MADNRIIRNKERYLELLNSIKFPALDNVIEYLNKSDFFEAPATTQYHHSYPGGLCEYTLSVYDNIVELAEIFCKGKYSKEQLILVALLHSISKANYYESYAQNKKVYTPDGSKFDNLGKFEWQSVSAYKVKEPENRWLSGNPEMTSFFIINEFFKLGVEESYAICYHNQGFEGYNYTRDVYEIFRRYPLVSLLHNACILSSYVLV